VTLLLLLLICCAQMCLPQSILGRLHGLPCQIIQSGADEAVPQELRDNGSVQQLGQRMLEAISLGAEAASNSSTTGAAAVGSQHKDAAGSSTQSAVAPQLLHVVEGAGHACGGHEDELVGLVCNFLQQLPLC
jgi:hypothetical protein